MTEIVVADTGPLIALARVGHLNILRLLYGSVFVPLAVREELQLSSGRPGAQVLSEAFEAGWIRVQAVVNPKAVSDLVRLLDQGEAEAIVLVSEVDARFLLIDDARGRRIATARGIAVVGIAGVLLAAKAQGLLPAVAPVLEALGQVGYRLSERLVAAVLALAEE